MAAWYGTPMFSSLWLGRRRQHVVRALAMDPSQPADHASWLSGATSIDHMHESCPRPGWLVYCAYFADVTQDRLLAGAMDVARLALTLDRRPPFEAALFDELREMSYPDLIATMEACLEAAPGARGWCDAVPTQHNPLLVDLTRHVEDELDALDDERAGPYRVADLDAADQARAAAYAMSLEAHAHRQHGLREALTARSAASAALFAMAYGTSHPTFESSATAALRAAYGWRGLTSSRPEGVTRGGAAR